jgi:hypothetical protein
LEAHTATWTQGTAITGTIHPLKSLSVVHICQLCAYRMRDMTIRYQFDGVKDYSEHIFCWKFAPSQFQWKELPWMVWNIKKSRYQNPRYRNAMHRGCIIWHFTSNCYNSVMNLNETNFGSNPPEWRGKELPLPVLSTPQKSLSVVHMCQLCAYRMRNMTIRYQFDGVPDYFEYVFLGGIRTVKIPMQGIAMNGMIYNRKLVSKSQICHNHAYRRYNMTICKQFDNVRHELK